MSIAQKVHAEFIRKKKKLALAESCTGGAISARLVAIPGASTFFLGSIVAYAPSWKKEFLHVKKETLQQFGAESPEIVAAMIQGLFSQTEADYAVAVSGNCPGTIFIGIGERGKELEEIEICVEDSRIKAIETTVEEALRALYHRIAS